MKKDRNNASPISTWFGGIDCVARDVRTKEKTMTILVKHVIMIKIPGAIENTVNSSRSLTLALTFAASLELNKLINSFMLILAFLSAFCMVLFKLCKLRF